MSVDPGVRFGPYEIVAAIGAGGMGEVYRARDTRLDRTVAIKVLPAHVSADANLRERFDREARAVAALNHPHICALYDIGEDGGRSYLVMEHLDGETLAHRLAKGALPVDQALVVAMQIADALDKAHRAGIVHRDLKPGNIMLTKPGAKLLDFGLAKVTPTIVAASGLSMAPTGLSPVTMQGTILGTLQYMAPEQIEGREADARTDIFAFGCVLYEMLTGRKAFEGKTQASLIGAILEREPAPIASIQPLAPRALDRIGRKCLAKDPDARWQTARDLADEMRWIAETGTDEPGDQRPGARGGRRLAWMLAAAAAVAVLSMVGVAVAVLTPARVPLAQSLELSLLPPPDAVFTPFYASGTPQFVLSPDGTRIAVVLSRPAHPPTLWVRAIDSSAAQELPGTDDAADPFWAPDSQRLGFYANGTLETVGLHDSRPQVLTKVASVRSGGGAWSPNGTILFADIRGGLSRVEASGGAVAPVTQVASQLAIPQRWPQFLPDGHRFIYSGDLSGATYLADLDAPLGTRIIDGGGSALFVPPGFLLFPRSNRLMAQAVDATSFRPVGEPKAIVDQIGYAAGSRRPPVTASATGLLAYWNGRGLATTLQSFDRNGALLPSRQDLLTGPLASFGLSRDGRQIAVTRNDDIWIVDANGAQSRFGFTSGAAWPIWSSDDRSLVYIGANTLLRRAISGAEQPQRLADLEPRGDFPTDWVAERALVLIETASGKSDWDIALLSTADGRRMPALHTSANEIQGRFSPDGRWLAYTSDESGRWEVYVQPYPLNGAKWQVSVDGGSQPVWRRDGRELFFLGPDSRLLSAQIETSAAAFSASPPRVLFQTRMRTTTEPFPTNYATVDGQRFLINSVAEGSAVTITMLSNWTARMER